MYPESKCILNLNDTWVNPVSYTHLSYNKGGEVGTATLESAGKVEKIRLSADRTEIVADGNDLSYIRCV